MIFYDSLIVVTLWMNGIGAIGSATERSTCSTPPSKSIRAFFLFNSRATVCRDVSRGYGAVGLTVLSTAHAAPTKCVSYVINIVITGMGVKLSAGPDLAVLVLLEP